MNSSQFSAEKEYDDFFNEDFASSDMSVLDGYFADMELIKKMGKTKNLDKMELQEIFDKIKELQKQPETQETTRKITSLRNKIVLSHLAMVVKISKRYMEKYLPTFDEQVCMEIRLEDIISIANEQLFNTLRKFDSTQSSTTFMSYAFKVLPFDIHRVILKEFQKVDLPVHVRDAVRAINAKARQLTTSVHQNEIDQNMDWIEQTAKKYSAKVEYVVPLLGQYVFSIDELSGSEQRQFEELLATDMEHVENKILNDEIVQEIQNILISQLSQREVEIIQLRFGLGAHNSPSTFNEIASLFSLSPARIPQIEAKARRKLRCSKLSHFLSL